MSLWKLLLNVMLMLVLAVTLTTACGNDDDDTAANDDDDTANDDDDDTSDDDDDDDDGTIICEAALAEDCVGDEEFNEETCLCECNITCTGGKTLDEDLCKCIGEALDPESLVNKTSAFICLLDPDFEIVEPAGIGAMLPSLVTCDDIPPIAFMVTDYDPATDTLQFIGTNLVSATDLTMPADAVVMDEEDIPPADFSKNPLFEIQVDGEIELHVEDITIRIFDLYISGEALAGGGFDDGVLAGLIDPAPLDSLIPDACGTILKDACTEEGYIPIRIENMVAEPVPGLIITPPAP